MKTITTLITDHIDIWTAAETEKKSGRGRASGNPGSVYGIKKLRELILELAVRGKLVPQDANDEPASELLKRIQAEKAKLIAEGKIRKGQPLAPITEQEKSFHLPVGWGWVRLGQIGDWGAGATPLRSVSSYYGGKTPWFKSGELTADFIDSSEETITELALKECSLRLNQPGDVLIAMYGATIGKTAILKVPGTTNQAVCACTPNTGIFNRYLLVLLKATKSNFIGQGAGGAQPNISREKIISTIVAVPPTAEQHRIVAKVDELMALCDQLENQHSNAAEAHEKLVSHLLGTLTQSQNANDFSANWQRIAAHFDTLFTTDASIDTLKPNLLQLAVMGVFTSDINVMTLKMFNADFEELLDKSTGSLRRGPFGSSIRKDMFVSTGYKVYEQKNAIRNDCALGDYYISKSKFEELSNFSVAPGDFIVSCAGTIGKISLLPVDSKEGVINQALMRIRTDKKVITDDFFIRLFESPYFQSSMLETTKGSAMKNLAAVKTIKKIKIWLPSLPEQSRIVAKVDELMGLCDQLKSRITDARQLQQKLADVMVEKAVA